MLAVSSLSLPELREIGRQSIATPIRIIMRILQEVNDNLEEGPYD